jgi:hypothetical protein
LVIGIEHGDGAFCPSNEAIEVMGFQESLSEVWTVISTGRSMDSFGAVVNGAGEEQ